MTGITKHLTHQAGEGEREAIAAKLIKQTNRTESSVNYCQIVTTNVS